MPRVYSSSRSAILDATERVILRDGSVSVDAVLAEAGVSKGGFFHHFKSKEALLGALTERLVGLVNERAMQTIAADEEAYGRALRAQIILGFDLPPAERDRMRALVLALLSAVVEAPAVARQARRANEDAVAKAVDEGVDEGTALLVQFALDGFFLAEAFGTIKLDQKRRTALRAAMLGLVTRRSKHAR